MPLHINPKKRTKIIATIGPSCSDFETIKALVDEGVDVVRINASHQSDPETVKTLVNTIRRASVDLGRWISVFVDLQGPKIRVGKIENDSVELVAGQSFSFYKTQRLGTEQACSISIPELIDDSQVGDKIFVDDGKIKMKVIAKQHDHIQCEVTQGGRLSNHKGVNLPDTDLHVSPLTDKDKQDLKLAVENNLDYVALSFVKEADDVTYLRGLLDELGGQNIRIISKIERPQAMKNIKSIVEVSDAVMVARGDLGVEIGLENVPSAQKQIIYECNRRIKPVIVATQMLETLIDKLSATRAEVSDIANAIYDHCDAVMLSAETAVGVDPVNAVRIMRDICISTDANMEKVKHQDASYYKFVFSKSVQNMATSFVKAADQIAQENNAKYIMAFTSTGQTPLIASKLNPVIPILGVTDSETTMRRLALYRGVIPIMSPEKFADIHRWRDMISLGVEKAKLLKLLKTGDTIVITAGIPINQAGGINSIRIQTV